MTKSSSPSAEPTPKAQFSLLSYTLRVHGPIEWDDKTATAVIQSLRTTVEPALAVIKQAIEEAHDLTVTVEE